jgi:hypothetical protein
VIVTTRVTYASIDDFINGAQPLEWEGFAYVGPVALVKKGRNNLQTAANAGNADTGQAQNIANKAEGIADSEINTTGGLSPLVSKQLANEKAQIGKAYSTAAAAADRGLSMRGMGVAPSGLTASIKNSAINNEGEAETGATGNAFKTQNELNNTAFTQPLNALGVANGGVTASTGAGTALNKAGSTLGDVGLGLSGLAGIGTQVFGKGGPLSGLNPNNG